MMEETGRRLTNHDGSAFDTPLEKVLDHVCPAGRQPKKWGPMQRVVYRGMDTEGEAGFGLKFTFRVAE